MPDPTLATTDDTTYDVAFVVPRSGPAGIVGPSCEACGRLAADEVNAAGGVRGRELRLHVVDGGREPVAVARDVAGLVAAGAVRAVTGWHTSAVRQALVPLLSGRVPYVYSPLYEGGERSPGVFLTGETPDRQLLPALRWMARERGVRTWCVVGDDYVWPQVSARVAREFAARSGEVRILDEVYVPLGTREFAPVVDRVARSGAGGVLMLLVGSDAVCFNRAFAAAGLPAAMVRLSPLMEENMVLATGAEATAELYAAAGFFEALATADGLDFGRRYAARFGVQAPVLNTLGESCYEGVVLLSRLAARAADPDPRAWEAAARSLAYDSPRGPVRMAGNHLLQRVYLARADGLELDVIDQLSP